jgi:threonine dehydratase
VSGVSDQVTSGAERSAPALNEPTIADVLAARRFLADHIRPTPLLPFRALGERLAAEAWLKCESLLPTGAFKVRGGLNLVGRDPSARAGIIAASTGNHGQSLAYAGSRFGVSVTIVVPGGANPRKVEAMRQLGAAILEHGRDFDDARLECERLAEERGTRYVHSGNEPLLIAGVATGALEVLLELPDADVLIVPVGGGSGAAGASLVARALAPRVRVIGVQSEGAPAAYRSWRTRELVEEPEMRTFAEGLATRVGFELPQRMLWRSLDDFILVSDEEIRAAMGLILREAHLVPEGAGAAATAAALRLGDQLTGKRVVCWLSGGNAEAGGLLRALGSSDG